jgi:hypothetical protein
MRRTVLAALVAVAVPLASARAQPAEPHPWVGGPLKDKNAGASAELADPQAKLTQHEREIVRAYFVEQHGRGKCPEGLSKKDNGCMPQGLSKRRYGVGQPLSPNVVIGPIPIELANRLGAPPRGYRYAIVDGDLLKLATSNLLVVDAVESLVN